MAIQAVPLAGAALRGALANYFTSKCTILSSTSTSNAYNEPVLTWAARAGHVNIPCAVAPGDVSVRMKRQETRSSEVLSEMVYKRVMLAGNYPSIELSDRASIAGETWAIVAIDIDITATFTELLVESLIPGDI